MRVLFFLEPLVMHSRPYHYWAWLGHFAEMARGLVAAGAEVRLVANRALAERAVAERAPGVPAPRRGHALDPSWVVALDQEPIRRLFERTNVAIVDGLHRGTLPPGAVAAYGALLRDALGGFVPDAVLGLGPLAQVAAAFPDAMTVWTETAPFSRAPFPQALFLDPSGTWERSAPVAHGAELLSRRAPAEELELLATFRRRFRDWFEAVSPFAELERELRARAARVAFLPLQFGGEPGFDVNAPFRTQGEYLFHVLEQLPADVGVLVVEHPTAYWVGDIIDEETREHVAARWPLVRFVDFRAAESAGQLLGQHADFTISVSSSLGFQALFFEKPLVAVGTSQLPFPAWRGIAGLPASLRGPDGLDDALAWLLTRYVVPTELAYRGTWLAEWLTHARATRRAGLPGVAAFMPVAPVADLAPLLFRQLDALAPLRGVLDNGDLREWSRGPGPFSAGRETADGWHLLDFSGGVVDARPGEGGAGVVVRRLRTGTGPTFFLARVPDAASSAGALARLRFRARSTGGAPLAVATYFYIQVDDGGPGLGAPAATITVGEEWAEHVYVAAIPPLGERVPGPGSHLEVVFALPPEAGEASFELADVRFEPVGQ